jgi:ABC-type phosphate transport system auxiliary subunit
MWNRIRQWYRKLRMPAAYRAYERKLRAAHEEEARKKFSTVRYEARLLAANKALEERAQRRFDMPVAKLQLEVVALEKQIDSFRAQLGNFERPFRDEYEELEAEMALLGERRRNAYAEKDAAAIEAVNADIAELQKRINAVRSDLAVQTDLRGQGLTPEKLRRSLQRCEARLQTLQDEQEKIRRERANYMNHSPDRAEIDAIERDMLALERKHIQYLRDFDAPAERRRREREHEQAWLNGA